MEKTTPAHKSEVKRSNWQPPTHSQIRQHSNQSSCGGCGACHKIARSTNASSSIMLKSLDPGKKICATSFLQRTYGNKYVQRLIQTKKDSPCQERCGSRTIQMKASGCCGGCGNHGKEEEKAPVQTKLTIGPPGDKYEQEADRISEQVMRMPEPQVQRQPMEEEEEELQMQAKPVAGQITPLVQKQPMEEEEEELQAKEVSGNTPDVTLDLETRLNASQSSGWQLPETDRSFMETRFGSDFSGVRVHTDSNAVQLNRELNAEAFTTGNNIYFGAGRYSPGSASGKRLLAHELTHVVQQGGSNIKKLSLDDKAKACTRLTNKFNMNSSRISLYGGPYIARAIKGVTNADGKGWLKVKLGSMVWPLPQYLKADHTSTSGGRDYFTVKEARWDGKAGSVKQKIRGGSYLATGMKYKGSATIKFEKSTRKLWYGRSGPVSAKTMSSNPVPNGTYDLEIPYEPHGLAARYESSANYAKTWFRIGHSGDRFLHPGSVSAGCATVTAVSNWDSIYSYLINSRKDKKSVGEIKVS